MKKVFAAVLYGLACVVLMVVMAVMNSHAAHAQAPTSAANTSVRASAVNASVPVATASATAPAHTKHPALAIAAAFSPSKALWVVGLNEEGRLFVQTSDDRGQSWSAQRVLDTDGDRISSQGDSPPKLAFGPNGVVIIAYNKPLSKPWTGEVRMLRSTDGGQTFSKPVTVHEDKQVITHRFESIAFDSVGRLHTFWIDKRDAAASAERQSAGRPGGGAYVGAAIYRNVSTDGGLTFQPDTKVADYSCECCRIALTATADGGVAALWRHVFDGSIRDHAFTRVQMLDAPPRIVRATQDNWKINACPHHGPSISKATDRGFHAVWFTMQAGAARVQYGRLNAEGAPVGKPVALPDAAAEHASIVSDGSQLAIAWKSFDGKQTRVRAWLSDDDGQHFRLIELAQSSLKNDYPVLLSQDGKFLMLWRTSSAIEVKEVALQ